MSNAAQRHALAISRAVADDDEATIKQILGTLNSTQMRALILELAARCGPSDTEAEIVTAAVVQASAIFGATAGDVLAGSQLREALDARHAACYASWLLGCSYSFIGRRLGRDHSTVMASVSKVGESPRLRAAAQRVARRLGWDRDLELPVGEEAS